MVVVAVGSSNPVKVSAVRRAFEKFFDKVQVYAVPVVTTMPPQPIGLQKVVRGSIERALRALEQLADASYGVGIEAGLVEVPHTITGYCDQQFAAIADRAGRITVGGGPCFEFPKSVVERVLREGLEVEQVMEDLSGIKNIGELQGAIGYLSNGAISRFDLCLQAVLMALIPRLNSKLYLGSSEGKFKP